VMKRLKQSARRVLPKQLIYLFQSIRVSTKLGRVGVLLSTFPNAKSKIRLGGEAGWTIPRSTLSEKSICYCVGCGEDISFDLELLAKYGCTVFAFDPTPRSIAYVQKHTVDLPGYRFYDFGIWDREGMVRFYMPTDDIGVNASITNLHGTNEYIEVRTMRLKQVVESHGHTDIALLKMDIEGAEHTVIRTIIEDNIRINVLLVEFDGFAYPTAERLAGINNSIQSLIRFGYRIYWIEGSNFTFVR